MKKLLHFKLTILFAALFLFVGCEDDDNEKKEEGTSLPQETIAINNFVWDNMNTYYFWNDFIPNSNPSEEADTYLFFDKLLYDEVDRWSFITDDYQGLIDQLSGISKSFGYSIRLFLISDDSNDLIGFIEYVEPGSPADLAGLYRGKMFYKIDNQQLTIENYQQLLSKDDITMTFGTFNADFSINPESPSVSMSAIEMQSDPILMNKVITHGGKKVAYLVYTSFLDEYNDDLEAVFADFKSQGVDELVLDLRYNSGGAVSSAILLSSMIAPQSAIDDVLLRTSYNDILTQYFDQEYADVEDFYVDRLQSNVNNLNLDKVVVLSTFKTASASEMVIYGLSPHMQVYHIGEQTHGKYYGSISIYDEDEKHNWAMQPIVMRAENKDNSINYNIGLEADLERVDFIDANVLYDLGDPREDFLALALNYLTGVMPTGARLKATVNKPITPINKESNLEHPLKYEMHYTLKK